MIEINNPADCCGCTACVSVCSHGAIQLSADTEGFLYPIVNKEKCVGCNLCEKVCPIKKRKEEQETNAKITVKEYYALRHKDKDILYNSSSGGAFSLIAENILEKKGVVCGVEYSEKGVVRHAFAENKTELYRFRGSKYSQSDIRGIFPRIKNYLKNNRYVLFSGTPCQVDGLRRFLMKDYPKLVTIDLVCHSVPSPLIFKEYIEYASKVLKNKVVGIDMRYKRTCGWSHRFSYRFHFENGKSTIDPLWVVNWGRLFFSELINRPSCGECQYTNLNRSGDFTIADFWDDDHKRPDIYSKDGTSLLLVNTEKGQRLFQEMKEQSSFWSISKDEAMQPCLRHQTAPNKEREQFWKYYHSCGFRKTYNLYFADSCYELVKKIIKRILYHGAK